MKGIFRLFTLVLMALSVFSCSQESIEELGQGTSQRTVTIKAGINNDAESRTILGDTSGEKTKVYWEEGDSFVLSIGDTDYTFTIDPAYSDANPSTNATFTCNNFPEEVAAGEYVAKYANATTPTQQAGTKEGLSDYQYMEALIQIATASDLEDVNIHFSAKISVIELALTHEAFKNESVSAVALRNGGNPAAESSEDASFTGDDEGKIVVYFALPAGKEFTATTITATCGEKTYVASINSAFTTTEGKLYRVKKTMTERTVVESGTCGDNLEWMLTHTGNENNLTLSITGSGAMYDYQQYDYTVPWYLHKSQIKSIELPSGLTSIGNNAFLFCKMTSIEIPATVTKIGHHAFCCTSLTSIQIPAAVTEIMDEAFSGCESLQNITFEKGSQLQTIGETAFGEGTIITSIVIPASVETIGDNVFCNANQLQNVTFEEGSQLQTIGSVAFAATAITSIQIPATVTSIGDWAFSGCNNLTSVHCLPTTPPTLGNNVFETSTVGFMIYVPEASVEDYREEWSSYEAYIMPEGSDKCGDNLNWELTGDRNNLKLTITGSGDMYDYQSDNLVPWYAYKSQIKSIELPSGLTSIGGWAFNNCKMTSIEIPAAVTVLKELAFGNCTSLKDITFEEGSQLTVIESQAFAEDLPITSIEIPASVETIGDNAFCNANQLQNVTFEEGSQLQTIGQIAFAGTAITSIQIPATVTSIGEGAFDACNKLTTVYCLPTTPPTLGNDVFETSTAGFMIYVPAASVGEYETQWNSIATYIEGE